LKDTSDALSSFINNMIGQSDTRALMADCYTFTLRSGSKLTYTNADVSIPLNGSIYAANSVLVSGLRYKCAAGLDVDQQQLTISARESDTINGVPFLQALHSGAFDGCEIQRERAFLETWSSAPLGSVILFKGRVGNIDHIGRTTTQITVNSDLILLDINIPRNFYSPQCVHVLYDSGCGLIKSAYGTNGLVEAGSNKTTIIWSAADIKLTQGTLVFSSGQNSGASATIKAVQDNALILATALPYKPMTGDHFIAYQGCAHTLESCINQFSNRDRFRGFPYVPPPTAAY